MKQWISVLMSLVLLGCGGDEKPAQNAQKPEQQVQAPAPSNENQSVQKLKDERMAAAKAKYDGAPDAVKSCADVLAKVGEGTLSAWGIKVKSACGKLPQDQQFLAAESAGGLNGDIVYSSKTDVAEIIDAIKTGSRQPFRFDEINSAGEWLAMNGNYQAQRNYAYFLQERGDWLNACIWRGVIIDSGHKDAGDGDVSNLKLACGKLDQAQIALAQSKEKTLLLEIAKNQ